MKLAKKLLDKCDNVEFWKSFITDFQLSSLCYFLSENGTLFLREKYIQYKKNKSRELPKKEEQKLEDEKVGEDRLIIKPPSMKDFLMND